MAKPKKSTEVTKAKSAASSKGKASAAEAAASVQAPPPQPAPSAQERRQQAAMRPLSNLSVASAGRNNQFLTAALVFSVAAHAAAMAVHFSRDAQLKLKNADPQLEVILLNAGSDNAPRNADTLAQVNLEGGGNQETGRVKSPLVNSLQMQDGDALTAARQRLQELEEEQKKLLSQLQKTGLNAPPEPDVKKETKPTDTAPSEVDLLQKQISRMEAEISRNVEDYNKRPKVHYYRPSASAYRFARYVEEWREKIEKLGTEHYPQAARGKVYGEAIVTVVIDKTGNLIDAVIEKSSGYPLLDQAALRTVRLGQPYQAFPAQIARDTDRISITRIFKYSNGTLGTLAPGADAQSTPAAAQPSAGK